MRDRRRVHILVIAVYLLYTIYEADWEVLRAGDFYRDLGVPLDVSNKALQTRFRRLTVQYHPDKVTAIDDRPAAEAFYVHLKQARDTLSDPAKRFAYDRFGPDMLQWRHCVTVRDYVVSGAQSIVPYYAAGAAVMVVLGILGYLEWGRYVRYEPPQKLYCTDAQLTRDMSKWRYLAFASLFLFEMHTVTRPSYPPLISKIINPMFSRLMAHPPYLPFQTLALARKACVTFFIALSQIGPLLSTSFSQPRASAALDPELAARQQLQRLDVLARGIDAEATRLMGLEMAPFAADEHTLAEVRAKMKEWLVQNTVRGDPEVRDAIGRVLQRRRVDAPAGAKGNR